MTNVYICVFISISDPVFIDIFFVLFFFVLPVLFYASTNSDFLVFE